uniref:Uncharacterized protein n=1 Tax=Curvibacter symbiont subsp. Hydra magnipapillata TaxID=667019 RepID=C9Y943_CURXX|nr:hypothetical protein Csp_A06440 [Curvibacter putative symbiont of Hydra magnipapillata]
MPGFFIAALSAACMISFFLLGFPKIYCAIYGIFAGNFIYLFKAAYNYYSERE